LLPPFPFFLFSDRKTIFFFLSKAHDAVLGISLQTNRDSRHASFNGTGYLCKQKNKTGSNLLQKNKNRQTRLKPKQAKPVIKTKRATTRYKNKTSNNPFKKHSL